MLMLKIMIKFIISFGVWKIPNLIKEVNGTLSGQQLFIADGHHRYKVAKEYQSKRLSRMTTNPSGQEAFNYVMTYFTNMDSRGLQIFPMHQNCQTLAKKPRFSRGVF